MPKQYIPSVEIGVKDYLSHGPLGFPVVDVGVTLLDGSYHAVDSSDMAFRQAGRLAMSEGMPKCASRAARADHGRSTSPCRRTRPRASMRSSRSGAARSSASMPATAGPVGIVVEAHLPESEMQDLIVELRSATAGVGTYTAKFHHLSELTGRLADQVLAQHKTNGA